MPSATMLSMEHNKFNGRLEQYKNVRSEIEWKEIDELVVVNVCLFCWISKKNAEKCEIGQKRL